MFNTVLIANRGAIAVRIIRTLKRLGIRAIAVYAESDRKSLHVRHADAAYCLGDGQAASTYLDSDKILAIAKESGAQAIHPGYGFLSENADFVRACDTANIVFIGPRPEQMLDFGLKHRARELATNAQVPLLPGSPVLTDQQHALQEAERVGYPVMLKSSAGGGGIGMQLCHNEQELTAGFTSVKRLGANNFADDSVFLEKYIARARHIEVQVLGDGNGCVVALGERDCSSQRRNQKVIEECPAPNLPQTVRTQLHDTAEQLLASVNYLNAGTVEFIVDADTLDFYFLEVNTRLQVEHGVTEAVFDVDLVEWMLKIASGEAHNLADKLKAKYPKGHAIQARIYAEDPFRNFQPSAGLLSRVEFPDNDGLRIDHWIESGIEVPPWFDPMLAKIIAHGQDRTSAIDKLVSALEDTTLYGSETNLGYCHSLLLDGRFQAGTVTTRYLNDFVFSPARVDVLSAGTQTTIQDYPGRTGLWNVGVPPSGAFDDFSLRLANQILTNAKTAAVLEITLQGPKLKFNQATSVAITGANIQVTLDGEPVSQFCAVQVNAGQTLALGSTETGARAYLAVVGGFQCPDYLGSKSTFTLGQFGGHNGRALRAGDVLQLSGSGTESRPPTTNYQETFASLYSNRLTLRVIEGPHGCPDFFTEDDLNTFFAHAWEVHYNSSRTGVRLIGPKPQWARSDGGEAGLHPSNIHDNAYAFGTVDFTGDMPVILGPDGPSLGGFVCPATVITADLWKLGQLQAGDKIRFVPISLAEARKLEAEQNTAIAELTSPPVIEPKPTRASPVIATLNPDQLEERVVYRPAGDHFLLVEYGDQVLDLRLRLKAHALMQWLTDNPVNGIKELTPGIRSLQIHYDSQIIDHQALIEQLQSAQSQLNQNLDQLVIPSRIVHLPLSWDDRACQEAIDKYQQSVRDNAPWCPSNLEFIRRINGLESIDAVKDIVFNANYLVMGLGDVYLGAPVATPIDPRHRLVTTKYNPARTWTAENSVGIGGSYMCVYGMEGPGGYQFVGRTLQMWNRYRQTDVFTQPWLLRFFDQVKFYPVSHEELLTIREQFPLGDYPLKIEHTEFKWAEYQQFLTENKTDIDQFTGQRQAAFSEELQRWHEQGLFHFDTPETQVQTNDDDWPEGSIPVTSPVSGSLWQSNIKEGDQVSAGDTLLILEAMKTEIPVVAETDGRVSKVLVYEGQQVSAGQALILIE